MKCDICKSKMQRIDTEVKFAYNNKSIKVINVPALFCHSCNTTVVPDLINKRLQGYASLYRDEVIDFKKCIDKEAEDTMIALNLMWG